MGMIILDLEVIHLDCFIMQCFAEYLFDNKGIGVIICKRG